MNDILKKLNLYLFFILLLGFSCMDAVTHSYIVNNTNRPIEVILKLNQAKIENSITNPDYELMLKEFASEKCVSIELLDTANLFGKYTIDPGCSFRADMSRGKEPSFNFNALIIVKSNDTIKYNSEFSIKEAFKYSRGFTFELKIE
jgi:hypothetical protein